MTLLGGSLSGACSASVAGLFGYVFPNALRPPFVANHRGRRIPVSLGFALTAGLTITEAVVTVGMMSDGGPSQADQWVVIGAIVAVFLVGAYDDRRPSPVHGIRSHLGRLARGHVTSGIAKLVVIAAAAAVVAFGQAGFGTRSLLGCLVIAGCANLWNLLDVAPGRALKAGIVASAGLLFVAPASLPVEILGASIVLLPADLRELAMLGDGGANVLGFALGVGLFGVLSVPGLAIALVVILALHWLAETLTLSRAIMRLRPLRWVDELGRIPSGPGGTGPEDSSSSTSP